MAESETMAKEHTAELIFLLENLGFIINSQNSRIDPTQQIEFLGFEINSLKMELKLPGEKFKKIRQDARRLLDMPHPKAIHLSRLLRKLNHASQAIPPAPLFYRNMQQSLRQALTYGTREYSNPVRINLETRRELQWWIDHLNRWNGKFLLNQKPSLTIETDASTTGWGATCQGVRTGGPWSHHERKMQINC